MYNFVLNESKCTNNCLFCYGRDFGDISGNVRRELEKLARIRDLGERVDEIEISGNDPAEYPDLPKVIRRIRELVEVRSVRLLTHGKALIDEAFTRALKVEGVTKIVVPIYGHFEAVHEEITRSPGSFRQTTDGIEVARKVGMDVSVTTLITRENQCTLIELFTFICSIDKEASIGIPHLSVAGFRDHLPDFNTLKADLSAALISLLNAMDARPWLRDIPLCMLSFPYPFIEDSHAPRFGYEHMRSSNAGHFGSDSFVPQYREKVKSPSCASCIFDGRCQGFYQSYVEGGLVRLDPVLGKRV